MSPRRGPGGSGRPHGWLELLQTSGPFLTLPVVQRVFGDMLPPVPAKQRAKIRALTADMLDSRGATRHALIQSMLGDVLDWQEHLRIDAGIPDSLAEPVPEYGLLIRPVVGFYADDADNNDSDGLGEEEEDDDNNGTDEEDDEDSGDTSEAALPGSPAGGRGPWKMLGCYLPWGTHPLTRTAVGGWVASGVERLAVLLRARDVPIGLVTDGRWWALVWAPRGGTLGAGVGGAAGSRGRGAAAVAGPPRRQVPGGDASPNAPPRRPGPGRHPPPRRPRAEFPSSPVLGLHRLLCPRKRKPQAQRHQSFPSCVAALTAKTATRTPIPASIQTTL